MIRWASILFYILLTSLTTQASTSLDWVKIQSKLDCEDRFLSPQMCIVSKVKDFSIDEKNIILTRLTTLQELYPQFFSKLLERTDKVDFFRHEVGVRRISTFNFRQDNNIGAWVTSGRTYIHIPDNFFKQGFKINEQHDSIDYMLIHELSHIIDNLYTKISIKEEFLSLYSWEEVPAGQGVTMGGVKLEAKRWQTMGIPYERVDYIREKVMALNDSGQIEERNRLSSEFGRSFGHPGSYSMINPYENFAEIIVSYFMDPESLQSAPPEVHPWLYSFFN